MCGAVKVVWALSFAVMLGSFGPVNAGSVDPKVMNTIYNRAQALGFAQNIAKNCRSIRLKRGSKRSAEKWLRKYRVKHGVKETEVRAAFKKFPKKRIQDDAFAFINDNGIIVGERQTYCVAGKKLIANGSAIGSFLVER
jgi:hypothetical protein